MLQLPFIGTPIITNKYRADPYNPHYGTDYAMPRKTGIIAVADGVVVASKYWLALDKPQSERQWLANTNSDPYKKTFLGKLVTRSLKTEDYGNYIKIDHGNSVTTLYAHLDEVCVHEGSKVTEGQLIGYSDSTGNSSGDHLHFEIRVSERVINPDNFDYSFKGEGGVEQIVHTMQFGFVSIVTDLYVRAGPARSYKLKGSRIVRKGDRVDVVGWVEGEEIDGNKVWFKSTLGNYLWSGGTDRPGLPEIDEHKIKMTIEEFESRKAALEARKLELETAMAVNVEDFAKFDAEFKAFTEAPVEEPVAEVVEEPVVEAPIEEPVVEVPAEPVVEAPVEEAKPEEDVKESVSKLEALLAEIKAKLGL